MNDIIKEWLNDNIDELTETIGTSYNNNYLYYGEKQQEIKDKLKQKGWLPVDALEEAREYYKNYCDLTLVNGDKMQKSKDLYEKAITRLQDKIKGLKNEKRE